MKNTTAALFCLIALTMTALQTAQATAPPDQVATVVIHGFDPDGVQQTGVFGVDSSESYITSLSASIGLPTSIDAPLAMNQVAYATYYGNQYPTYYTPQDILDVQAVTAQFGGGVPRYATIMAKYAKEVMRRSGAKQVNLFAVSFGGLISRYMIEKDVEGLASSGKIARWISVEGVVDGNYAATLGGSTAQDLFESYYGAPPIDVEHMTYDWVEANINNPRDYSVSPFLGQFPVHFWQACDDDFNSKGLTYISGKANDGVVLIEDAYLKGLGPNSRYLGLDPTISCTHTTHESTKDFPGIRAGVAAELFGRRRVNIQLEQVRVRKEFDGGIRGNGEYVFGLKVRSPRADTLYGITAPIHQLRSDDNNIPYVRMAQDTTVTVNLTWFDDMILPGETELHLETNVDEIDGDLIYNIAEDVPDTRQDLKDTSATVSTMQPGEYTLETDDWRAIVKVNITDYPDFDDGTTPTAAMNWNLYN